MSCSPYDLRDYFFDELNLPERDHVRTHLKTCEPCGAELESLRATRATLLSIQDEEIPQRIGFVSDKVFEPSPVRRWFAGFWTSAARIGFVSSAMFLTAILVATVQPNLMHSFAQSVAQSAPNQSGINAEIDRRVKESIAAQLPALVHAQVAAAVSQAEDRAQKRTKEMLAVAEKRHIQEERNMQVAYQETYDLMRTRANVRMVAANYGGTQ